MRYLPSASLAAFRLLDIAAGTPSSVGLASNAAAGARHTTISQTDHMFCYTCRAPLPILLGAPRHRPVVAGRLFSSSHMAHNKSQEKRNRQTIVRTARNKAVRSELKTRIKSAVAAAESGDAAAAAEALRLAQKRIDQAAAKGVLKKNTAARRKRNLVRQVRRIG